MQETRRLLLRAAGAEFAAHGYDQANVSSIAEAAGFSVGTVYNYFPSKRELMLAFIDEIGQMHADFIVGQVHQETDPNLRIRAFFRAGFAFVEANIYEARGIFNALNGPDEEFRLRLFQAYTPLFDLLKNEVLDLGVAQGAFRPEIPATTAGLIMLIYLGTGSQLNPEGKLWLDSEEVADFVLHALRIDSTSVGNYG